MWTRRLTAEATPVAGQTFFESTLVHVPVTAGLLHPRVIVPHTPSSRHVILASRGSSPWPARPAVTPNVVLIQGQVTLLVVIDAKGVVTGATVAESLDAEHGLDTNAIDAVMQWSFLPGTIDGVAKPFTVKITMEFSIARLEMIDSLKSEIANRLSINGNRQWGIGIGDCQSTIDRLPMPITDHRFAIIDNRLAISDSRLSMPS